MAYYIGIDVGTSSVKAALLRDGKTRTYRALYNETLGNTPEGWWKAVCDAVAQVAASEGPDCAGLGLTAQVGTYLLADPEKPASAWPVHTWGGPGGETQREALQARFGTDFFMKYTGMPLPKVPSYPASRLRWFIEERPEEWKAAKLALAPKDFLYERLTGKLFADTLSWNGLADPHTGEPAPEFLEALGLEAERFAPMRSSLSAPAGLSAETAARLGLPEGTPVYLGCNDSHASFLGMGISGIGQAFDLTGTSEHVGLISPAAMGNGETICSPFFEGCASFGVTASSGSSIDWGYRICEMPQDAASEAVLTERFEAVTRGEAHPPVFLPYVTGERSPIWDGGARGVFAGISADTTRADLLYSVLEGVVFSVAHIWYGLPAELTGSVRALRLGGGACENRMLNRMKAAILGLTLEIPTEKNTGALGAGLIAAAGSRRYPDLAAAVDAYVTLSGTVAPQDDPTALRRRFELYRRMSGLNRDFGVAAAL